MRWVLCYEVDEVGVGWGEFSLEGKIKGESRGFFSAGASA